MKKYCYILVAVMLLFLTRAADFNILWRLGNLEVGYLNGLINNDAKSEKNIHYHFKGFSNQTKAAEMLNNIVKTNKYDVVIVCYFNLMSPYNALIHSKKKSKTTVILPWLPIKVNHGLTEVKFWKFDFVEIISKGFKDKKFVEVGGSVLCFFSRDSHLFSGSFLNDIAKYVDKIHIIYFYFPLILIGLLFIFYSKKIFVSNVYFFLMLLLFSTPSYWRAPGRLLELIFGTELDGVIFFMVFCLSILAYFLLYRGIKYSRTVIKEKGITALEKMIIAYFILLPLFLRF